MQVQFQLSAHLYAKTNQEILHNLQHTLHSELLSRMDSLLGVNQLTEIDFQLNECSINLEKGETALTFNQIKDISNT